MELIMDNRQTENDFREILQRITQSRSGEVAAQMKSLGEGYRHQWGVALTELRDLARNFQPSHLLALKLWNKQWRETMILATLLDEPDKVTEEQMDYWTHSFENSEIAEQASANLWCRTPWAYAKALEWCRGKKHWIRYTAVHLVGRLAMTDKKSPEEMFDPFYEELLTLSKDPRLSTPLYRSLVILANRSGQQQEMVNDFIRMLGETGSEASAALAGEIRAALSR